MAAQLGFAEAFLSDKAGQNRRLSRIEALIDWSAFLAHLPPAATAGPGRPAYPVLGRCWECSRLYCWRNGISSPTRPLRKRLQIASRFAAFAASRSMW